MKKLLRDKGLVERVGVLLERGGGGGGSKVFHQFSFGKAFFHDHWNTFFCLVNIQACCNQ